MRFMKWESQWALPMNHCEIIIIQHQLGLHMIESNIPFTELAEYGEYAHSIRNYRAHMSFFVQLPIYKTSTGNMRLSTFWYLTQLIN